MRLSACPAAGPAACGQRGGGVGEPDLPPPPAPTGTGALCPALHRLTVSLPRCAQELTALLLVSFHVLSSQSYLFSPHGYESLGNHSGFLSSETALGDLWAHLGPRRVNSVVTGGNDFKCDGGLGEENCFQTQKTADANPWLQREPRRPPVKPNHPQTQDTHHPSAGGAGNCGKKQGQSHRTPSVCRATARRTRGGGAPRPDPSASGVAPVTGSDQWSGPSSSRQPSHLPLPRPHPALSPEPLCVRAPSSAPAPPPAPPPAPAQAHLPRPPHAPPPARVSEVALMSPHLSLL